MQYESEYDGIFSTHKNIDGKSRVKSKKELINDMRKAEILLGIKPKYKVTGKTKKEIIHNLEYLHEKARQIGKYAGLIE